jgi:predicted CoA-binding protein
MASAHEMFWAHSSYAVVGHSAKKGFPRISYTELKKQGRKIFAVDPSVDQIDGDKAYPDLYSLPERVDAVVLEVPREDTLGWVKQVADAGIKDVWVHMNRDTPEAVQYAREKGLNILTGTCAVMYLASGFSAHSMHKWVNKLLKQY